MGFNLAQFKSPPVKAVFEKNGGLLNLEIDADIITANFLQEYKDEAQAEAARKAKEAGTPVDAQLAEFLYTSKVLSRVIKIWDVEDNGVAVLPTVEVFKGMSVFLLGDLLNFCFEAITPKKSIETTSAGLLPAAGVTVISPPNGISN